MSNDGFCVYCMNEFVFAAKISNISIVNFDFGLKHGKSSHIDRRLEICLGLRLLKRGQSELCDLKL